MSHYVKYIPFTIIFITSLLGFINGIRTPLTTGTSNNLWVLLNSFYIMEDLHKTGIRWWPIAKHNISWSFLYGILGLFSGGIFTSKFLYNAWYIWTIGFNMYTNLATRFFIVLESLGMTGIITFVIGLGYQLFTKNKQYVPQQCPPVLG